MFPSVFQPFREKKLLTQYWQFLHKGVFAQILSGRLVMNVETISFSIPCVCQSVVQYEENNFWVDLLSLSFLVFKLSHVEIQSHNLAVWSAIFSLSISLSVSLILLHLLQNSRPESNSQSCIVRSENNVAYRIVDPADSKKKVKEDCVSVPL
jgi:hypothetical protein